MKRKLVDGKLTQLVETGAVVVPDLPETFPADVNVDFYVSQAETLVKAITEPALRQSHTIPIAELSKAQRAALELRQGRAGRPGAMRGAESGAASRRLGQRRPREPS